MQAIVLSGIIADDKNIVLTDACKIGDPIRKSLANVPKEKYIVKETVLNRSSGSAFDTWISMDAIELASEDELGVLASRSVPGFSKYIAEAEDGTVQLDAMLEVRLLTVKPLDLPG